MDGNEDQLVIRDYEATWPTRFSALAIREKTHLGALVTQVEHVELRIAGQEAFRWPPGEPRHHLYVLHVSAPELRRHLAFRDALRAVRMIRDAYSESGMGVFHEAIRLAASGQVLPVAGEGKLAAKPSLEWPLICRYG